MRYCNALIPSTKNVAEISQIWHNKPNQFLLNTVKAKLRIKQLLIDLEN